MKPVYRIADTRKTILNKSLRFVTKELLAISKMEDALENMELEGDEFEKMELLKQVESLKSTALTYLRDIERLLEFEAKQSLSFSKRYNNAKIWFLLSGKSL